MSSCGLQEGQSIISPILPEADHSLHANRNIAILHFWLPAHPLARCQKLKAHWFSVLAPVLWNQLPLALRAAESSQHYISKLTIFSFPS
ncbi:hypothetical protein Z043_110675 [Scleropages formosus]|uniref:Uncharacterized protein n=1 Tax=Scleropages formosus TaxID=113540 RepID=A0A0P7UNG3_SCLFO|nr:hypothetical protein Z043_110675 [Scleropages formosus]